MNIIGVIPARYASMRFPGKPLADIHGKPMIWWVYSKLLNLEVFSDVICAIDDNRVEEICKKYNIKYMMTDKNHPNHISRIHEVSTSLHADYYMCINGDEPLVSEECIIPVLPKEVYHVPIFIGAMRILNNPAEVIDFSNIKIVADSFGKCIYMSRSPIPYPRGTLLFEYKKYVGVECFNKRALDFFVNTPMGEYEKIEDIDHLRFIENGISINFREVQSDSISVDTPKDLEKVRKMMEILL